MAMQSVPRRLLDIFEFVVPSTVGDGHNKRPGCDHTATAATTGISSSGVPVARADGGSDAKGGKKGITADRNVWRGSVVIAAASALNPKAAAFVPRD